MTQSSRPNLRTNGLGIAAQNMLDRFTNETPVVQHRRELLRKYDHPDVLTRCVQSGHMIRVAHGYYARADRWSCFSDMRRHRELARAAARRLPTAQFSHATAALLLGLPWLDPVPSQLHTLVGEGSNDRPTALIQKHRLRLDPRPARVSGVSVTSPARTVFDVACVSSFANGLACADNALSRGILTANKLKQVTSEQGSRVGIGKARLVAELADSRIESPAESFCRSLIYDLGFVLPIPQYEFWDAGVPIARGDFCWPEQRVWLEFDGLQKYKAAEYRNGRSAEEVVVAEKRREDRIRALGFVPIRFIWADLYQPQRVERELLRKGIPRR